MIEAVVPTNKWIQMSMKLILTVHDLLLEACIEGAYLDDLYTYIKYSLHLRQSKWLTDMA